MNGRDWDWAYGCLCVVIVIGGALAMAVWLLLAAQTVGVEAWHDSALPQGAFTAIRSAGPTDRPGGQRPHAQASEAPGYARQSETAVGLSAPKVVPALHQSSTRKEVPAVRSSVKPSPSVASLAGTASTYGPGFDGYLALPAGRGIHVRICGAGGCIDRVSNDKGPVPSLHRVADLDVADFEKVCGCPWTMGLCRVTVEVLP